MRRCSDSEGRGRDEGKEQVFVVNQLLPGKCSMPLVLSERKKKDSPFPMAWASAV